MLSTTESKKKLILVLIGILFWTLFGLLLAYQTVVARPLIDGETVAWSEALFESAFICLFWGLATVLIFRIIKRHPFRRSNWGKCLLIHAALSLGLSTLFLTIYVVIAPYELNLAVPTDTAWQRFKVFASISIFTSGFLYALVFVIGQSIYFYQTLRQRELTAKQLETDLVSSQLNQLRSQLHPHFLFNTLSAITTLIHDDPSAAERTVVGLGELLRLTLDLPESDSQPMVSELDFLHRYVELQSIRFSDRLKFEEDIDPASLDALVPCLILQPIVENAIKHGAGESMDTCIVRLTVRLLEGTLAIEVSDTGPGPKEGLNGKRWAEGVGLRNTRQRLEHMYGDQFVFECSTTSPGFQVKIELPFQVKEPNEC